LGTGIRKGKQIGASEPVSPLSKSNAAKTSDTGKQQLTTQQQMLQTQRELLAVTREKTAVAGITLETR
jgi:hypothetical protein